MREDTRDRLDRAFEFDTSANTQALVAELGREAERAAGRKPHLLNRFGSRTLISAGVVALLSAGAATAVAAPRLFDWLNYTPDASSTLEIDGLTCEVAYIVKADYANNPHPEEAVASAKEYLRTLDLTTLPVQQRIVDDAARNEQPIPAELDTMTVGSALAGLIFDGMNSHLVQSGLPTAVSLESGTNCVASDAQ
jgi:hypothetical protein